jgi:hypothetical protein
MKESKSSSDFLHYLAGRLEIAEIAARPPEPSSEQPFVSIAGGHRQFAAYVGSEFLGSLTGSAGVYPLVLALRRLGCPIVMGRSRRVLEERPGAAWVTFRCTDEKLQELKASLAEIGSGAIHDVTRDIRVLVVQAGSVEIVAHQLARLSTQRHSR